MLFIKLHFSVMVPMVLELSRAGLITDFTEVVN